MNRRTRVGFVAALLVFSISASVEAAPRGGGGARGAFFHGGGHRFAVRPVARIAPAHRLHRLNSFAGHGRFGFQHRFGHHGRFGHQGRFDRNTGDAAVVGVGAGAGMLLGSPYDWGGNAVPSYAPVDPGPADPPVPALGEVDSPVATATLTCRTSAQTVPRERGGVTQVRVTRCYPPNP